MRLGYGFLDSPAVSSLVREDGSQRPDLKNSFNVSDSDN